MASGRPWTTDELMIAMNLYCKLPFGQLDHRNTLIIEVAQRLGRTPSSLFMKLCNIASLDPRQQARGIKGLGSSSKGDKEIWYLFNSDWERYGVESEESLQSLLAVPTDIETTISPLTKKTPKQTVIKMPDYTPSGPTEAEATAKVRIGQRFFRQSVLASYNSCCLDRHLPVL